LARAKTTAFAQTEPQQQPDRTGTHKKTAPNGKPGAVCVA
jgi:hypothetical protein